MRIVVTSLLAVAWVCSARAAQDVTASVVGRVIEGKNPIAGVRVFAQLDEQKSAYVATTDNDGRFRLPRLAPGSYKLTWRQNGYYPVYQQFQVGFGSQESPPHIAPAAGGQQRVELEMKRSAVLRGRVFAPNGTPVANRLIWLLEPRSMHFFVFSGYVRTDAQGEYEIVTKDNAGDSYGCACPGVGYAEMKEWRTHSGETTRLDFHLRRGGSLTGRVVADDGVTPIADASVSISGGKSHVMGAAQKQMPPREQRWDFSDQTPGENTGIEFTQSFVLTDADGRYRLEAIPDGEYEVSATGCGFQSQSLHTRVTDGSDVPPVTLRLSERIPDPPKPASGN